MTTIDDDAKAIMERARYLKELALERATISREVGNRIEALRERARREIAEPEKLNSFIDQLDSLNHSLIRASGK